MKKPTFEELSVSDQRAAVRAIVLDIPPERLVEARAGLLRLLRRSPLEDDHLRKEKIEVV